MLPGVLGRVELEFPTHRFKVLTENNKNTLEIDGKVSSVFWFNEHERNLASAAGPQVAITMLTEFLNAKIRTYFQELIEKAKSTAPVTFQTFVPPPSDPVEKELKINDVEEIIEVQTTEAPVVVETTPPEVIPVVEEIIPEVPIVEEVVTPKRSKRKK